MITKTELRKELLEKRALLTKNEIDTMSAEIFAKAELLQCYKSAKTIMLYITFGNEINTIPFLAKAIGDNKTVVTPICEKNRSMKLAVTAGIEGMAKNKMGILEMPLEGTEFIEPEALDLIIVPGLAFTPGGDRIGYGGGYYDTLFSKAEHAVRLCPSFDSFIVDSLPTESHDYKVDIIITELRSFFCFGEDRAIEL